MKSNYVLYQDGLKFYVHKKIGTKKSYKSNECFSDFYETQEQAYKAAILRTVFTINNLKEYIKEYKKEIKKNAISIKKTKARS